MTFLTGSSRHSKDWSAWREKWEDCTLLPDLRLRPGIWGFVEKPLLWNGARAKEEFAVNGDLKMMFIDFFISRYILALLYLINHIM